MMATPDFTEVEVANLRECVESDEYQPAAATDLRAVLAKLPVTTAASTIHFPGGS